MTRESAILRDIRAALNTARDSQGHFRCRVVRNTVGVAETDGRAFRYGLGTGSPDLVGMLRGGRAFAVEVKRPGQKLRAEQQAWFKSFYTWGGLGGVATSVDEALAILSNSERFAEVDALYRGTP